MNGIFDFYTCQPIKGYWALYGFADLCDLGTYVNTASDSEKIFASAATDGKNSAVLLSYYTTDCSDEERTVSVSFSGKHFQSVDVHTIDDTHDYDCTETLPENETNTVSLKMKPNTLAVLKCTLK
jgi:hypothetical protein